MHEMIKSILSQIKILEEELCKVAEIDPPAQSPSLPSADIKEQNSKHLEGLFRELKQHHMKDNIGGVQAVRGQIKDHVLTAPKGSVDIGHLGDLLQDQHYGKNIHNTWIGKRKAMGHEDINEMLNRHLGDVKSIKEIHDQHGGMKAVETVMRAMGSNGEPHHYSGLKFKKPGVHEDLLDLVWPGKAKRDRQERQHEGVLPRQYLNSEYKTPEAKTEGEKLQANVDNTFEGTYGSYDGNTEPTKEALKAHKDAVIARGLHKFKHHFGL